MCFSDPTWASRSISHALSPSPSPLLRAMDKTPTKADFAIGKQTLVLVEQPLGLSVEGHSTMPPSTPVEGQMTNDAQALSPKVLTDQNAGQVSAPVRPEWDTASLPISTEMTSSPSPNSAPAVTYAKAAKLLVNLYQSEPPSLVAPPVDPSETRIMCLLETVTASVANLSSLLTNVEQNLVSSGYPEEPDQFQCEDLARFPNRLHSKDILDHASNDRDAAFDSRRRTDEEDAEMVESRG